MFISSNFLTDIIIVLLDYHVLIGHLPKFAVLKGELNQKWMRLNSVTDSKIKQILY